MNVILLQGDSITDAGREKKNQWYNSGWSFGTGYAYIIASWLLREMAGKELTLYKRGISGNKVYQLTDRWDKDCLDLKPNVLGILIGVNDYRKLLEKTKEALPRIRLVICRHFVLTDTWLEAIG